MVEYCPGQIVSRTLAQNSSVSLTLFAFDKGEEISTHAAGGDALVTCLEAVSYTHLSKRRACFVSLRGIFFELLTFSL